LLLLVALIGELGLAFTGMDEELDKSKESMEELEAQMLENSLATVQFEGDNEKLTEQILKGEKALRDEVAILAFHTEEGKRAFKVTKDRIGGLKNLSDRESNYIRVLAMHKDGIKEINNEAPRNLKFLSDRRKRLAAVQVEQEKLIKTQIVGLRTSITERKLEQEQIIKESNEGRVKAVKTKEKEIALNKINIQTLERTWRQSKEFWDAYPEKEKEHLERLRKIKEENADLKKEVESLNQEQLLANANYARANDEINEFTERIAELEIELGDVEKALVAAFKEQLKSQRWKRMGDNVASVTEPYKELVEVGVDFAEISAELAGVFAETFEAGKAGSEEFADKITQNKFAMLAFKEMAIEASFAAAAALTKISADAANAQMELIRKESDARIEALEKDRKFQKKSQKQKDAILKQEEQRLAAELKGQFKKKQEMARIGVIIDTAAAIMVAYKDERGAPTTHINAALASAAGLLQLATINSQQAPTFAEGGLIGGKPHSQGGTMINAESGEFVMNKAAVEAVGVETMNQINRGGSAGGINISFTGNVVSDDFIEGEALPKIREAIRRGAKLGIDINTPAGTQPI